MPAGRVSRWWPTSSSTGRASSARSIWRVNGATARGIPRWDCGLYSWKPDRRRHWKNTFGSSYNLTRFHECVRNQKSRLNFSFFHYFKLPIFFEMIPSLTRFQKAWVKKLIAPNHSPSLGSFDTILHNGQFPQNKWTLISRVWLRKVLKKVLNSDKFVGIREAKSLQGVTLTLGRFQKSAQNSVWIILLFVHRSMITTGLMNCQNTGRPWFERLLEHFQRDFRPDLFCSLFHTSDWPELSLLQFRFKIPIGKKIHRWHFRRVRQPLVFGKKFKTPRIEPVVHYFFVWEGALSMCRITLSASAP